MVLIYTLHPNRAAFGRIQCSSAATSSNASSNTQPTTNRFNSLFDLLLVTENLDALLDVLKDTLKMCLLGIQDDNGAERGDVKVLRKDGLNEADQNVLARSV
jgi:hypothetical protein